MLRDDYAMVEKLVKGVVAREKKALQEEIATLRAQVASLEKKLAQAAMSTPKPESKAKAKRE